MISLLHAALVQRHRCTAAVAASAARLLRIDPDYVEYSLAQSVMHGFCGEDDAAEVRRVVGEARER